MTANTLFPGRPDYTGPTSGYFGLLHHEQLFEISHDVMERVAYVKREKAENEVDIRLHNMIYLPFVDDAYSADYKAKRTALYADYKAKCTALDADYDAKRTPLDADYKAKCAPLDADYEAKWAPLYADYMAKRAPLYADYKAKCAPLYADYDAKRTALYADYKAKWAALDADILAFIKTHIPDCAWDGRELVFGK